MEVEHATIPPYLTALATLMAANNSDIQNRLRGVFIQEMFHLALAANILNAVGGKPSLNYSGFIPDYPSVLPGDLHPKLIVPIKKFTRPLVKDVFSMIEQPEVEVATLSSFKHIFRFVRRIKDRLGYCQRNEAGVNCELTGNIITRMNPSGCFISKAEKAQFLAGESDMIILFNHKVLCSYQKLVRSLIKQSTFRNVITGFSTNEKYYPDMGCDASSVWNFCARLVDVISRGNSVGTSCNINFFL